VESDRNLGHVSFSLLLQKTGVRRNMNQRRWLIVTELEKMLEAINSEKGKSWQQNTK
jgi:hypothetical protein